MILKWTPFWYELDETIIVGDVDWFCITDKGTFKNGCYSANEVYPAAKMEIVRITHPVLGDIKGIVTIGLDYTIYLNSGETIIVNAEEEPGKIYDTDYLVNEWSFDVLVNVIEEGSITIPLYSGIDRIIESEKRRCRYKSLLGIETASWDKGM